ncbi:hypothetical protein [Acidiphilium acidophilum]|uniref:hypothetical protein n=1 Tax=Acidiphilium acidophilum TaxID=76588 RepID=UPI002E8E7443|nr:hypothetical protein [Acidiphilium acidophilum]
MSGRGRGGDSFSDAPAPALQRMVGRWPVASAVILIATNAAIAIHTGMAAWRFPITGEFGRLGIIVVWLTLMILLSTMCWTFWIASRLRWVRGQIMASTANDNGPETARIIRNGARLVALSERSHLATEWSLWAGLVLATIGIGLVIRAHG